MEKTTRKRERGKRRTKEQRRREGGQQIDEGSEGLETKGLSEKSERKRLSAS